MEYKVQGIAYSVGLMPAGFLSQDWAQISLPYVASVSVAQLVSAFGC